jgi:hypothetical protein
MSPIIQTILGVLCETVAVSPLKAETAALADSREEEGRRLRCDTAETAMEMTAAVIIVFLYIETTFGLVLFQSALELLVSVG